jgi:hypothetical protein
MCTETPVQGVFLKDSGSSKGECLHFWATVFQFDANTGPCALLARYGDKAYRNSYQFTGGIVRIEGLKGPSVAVDSSSGSVLLPNDSCNQLRPIIEGNQIEVWGINTGTSSYSTTAGGGNTYTKFGLVDAYKY